MRLVDLLFAVAAFVATETAQVDAGALFRYDPTAPVVPVVLVSPTPEPSAPVPVPLPAAPVEIVFEKTCSFNVVKLDPGLYASDILLSQTIYNLWTDTDARTANKWLYPHVSGDCVARGREVAYRYTWHTTVHAKLARAFEATGRATTEFREDRLFVTVNAPIWIVGEIGQGVRLFKVR